MINEYLTNLKNKNIEFPIYIDNLHCPYILLNEEFSMPSISNHLLSDEENWILVKLFSEFIPQTLKEKSFLVKPISKRDTSRLNFVEEFSCKGSKFILLFSIEAKYLGGSLSSKILKPSTQTHFPSYLTDRIYFHSRIIPVSEIIKKDNFIIDFTPVKNEKTFFNYQIEFSNREKPEFISEMFDELDFKSYLKPFYENLKISRHWALGKIYEPVGIEFLCPVLRLISIYHEQNIEEFKKFSEILTDHFNSKNFSDQTIYFFYEWLKKFNYERKLSPSGNLRWEIKTYT